MNKSTTRLRLHVEELETRLTPAIRLDLVALQEFGHSLGLAHHPNPNSIMYAYYNPNYSVANFANDPAIAANASDGYTNLLELFTPAKIAANTTSWKDSLDPSPGNGRVDVTYSFMPDGAKAESNKTNTIFAKFNALFGSPSVWQGLMSTELNRWASVSNGLISFSSRSDNGATFNTGVAQNSPNFGDIRIGAHRMDRSGGTLGHAYYPPPNGASAAGDVHWDEAEAWVAGGTGPMGLGAPGGNLPAPATDLAAGLAAAAEATLRPPTAADHHLDHEHRPPHDHHHHNGHEHRPPHDHHGHHHDGLAQGAADAVFASADLFTRDLLSVL